MVILFPVCVNRIDRLEDGLLRLADGLLRLENSLLRLEDSLLRLADRLVDNPIIELSDSLYFAYIQ